jgi:hypothetical protein
MSQFPKGETITRVGFSSMIEGMPTTMVVTLYCISKYYEKWRLTEWCLIELIRRKFTKEDVADFDGNFVNFFDQMLKQEDL